MVLRDFYVICNIHEDLQHHFIFFSSKSKGTLLSVSDKTKTKQQNARLKQRKVATMRLVDFKVHKNACFTRNYTALYQLAGFDWRCLHSWG